MTLDSQDQPNAPTEAVPRRRSGKKAYVTAGLVAVIAAAGAATAGAVTYQAVNAPALVTSSLFGNNNVTFDQDPKISVQNGRIESVKVKPVDGGKSLSGYLQSDGSVYRIDTTDMAFGTKYKVKTVAANRGGSPTVARESFRVFQPESTISAGVNITDGATYGVGMPITITFSAPVTDRSAVESRLKVSSDAKKDVKGSWSWDSDTSVSYRPKKYWPANTTVKLQGETKGVQVGNDVALETRIDREFEIGDKVVMTIDSNTHQMQFKKDGKTVREMPVSLGRPGYETRSGIKVLMSQEQDIVFDAATMGVSEDDPEYYRLDIAYAMRLTWSGEYIHSAPWSVGSQGYANVSHGCTNVSTENAIWIMENSNVGDIVEVRNTGREQDLGNGITVWNETWSEWKSGSAL
jgi:lipoprotein-anchoring transpeptidase ErfK/SrfK